MSYLAALVDSTRARVEAAKAAVPPEALEQRVAGLRPARDFEGALRGDAIAVIAEIKRASPSKGVLAANLPAGATAAAFARGGAAAISVLTEPESFRGHLDDLEAASVAGLPVLRKDFVIDPFQVLESRAAGADAVLLIARIVDAPTLRLLLDSAAAVGLEALVEVHEERELEDALAAGARVIGINQRDLESFEVDDRLTAKLAPLVPTDRTLVALSGISTRDDVLAMESVGARAALIGEVLVISSDPEAKLRELRGA